MHFNSVLFRLMGGAIYVLINTEQSFNSTIIPNTQVPAWGTTLNAQIQSWDTNNNAQTSNWDIIQVNQNATWSIT